MEFSPLCTLSLRFLCARRLTWPCTVCSRLRSSPFGTTYRCSQSSQAAPPTAAAASASVTHSGDFLTAILNRGLMNDFFFRSHLLFSLSIWTFMSFFSLDSYFPFLYCLSYKSSGSRLKGTIRAIYDLKLLTPSSWLTVRGHFFIT